MANYYLNITPIDTLSTSTYSIYFDEIIPGKLIFSGVPQSELVAGKLIYFTGSASGATSAIVKNEDPDCCCSSQTFVFPTPSPTSQPTSQPTAQPTTPQPTSQPTTPQPTTSQPTSQPTTPQPTTPQPTTPQPTSLENYTITLTNPGSGNNSSYQLGGSFNTGDTVVIRAVFSGTGGNAVNFEGRADLTLFNDATSSSTQSSCFPVGTPMSWNLQREITFSYNTINSVIGTTAVVNNGSASLSGLTVSIVSVNGIAVTANNASGNKGTSGGSVC